MVNRLIVKPQRVNTPLSIPKGQAIAGNAIGILVLDLWYPYLPGNVANASTYDFPVHYKILEGTTLSQIFNGDSALIDQIIEGGQQLEKQGVRAIIGACGYLGNYQKETTAILHVPVFLSSLLQVPVISRGLKPNQKVGIICAVSDSLTPNLLSQCGVDELSNIVIAGAQDLSEFQNIIRCTGHLNSYKLEQQLVDLAKQFVSKNPDIGAILLECSDMPPYAWAIQNAVGLPVFDFYTLINWVYNSVVRRPFTGFI
ncbi:hypothetical protein ES707_21668 [subsurface metagenome]